MRLNMDMFIGFSNELTVNMYLLLKKLIHKCTLNTNEYYPEKENLNARRDHKSSRLRYEFYFLNRNPVF